MKIIDWKHLCTFITLRDQKIMKFLCFILNFSKNYEISLFGLNLLAPTVCHKMARKLKKMIFNCVVFNLRFALNILKSIFLQ